MLLKRHIPLLIVISVGLLTLFGHFIDNDSIHNFVKNIATEWFDIIASFAIFLGAFNLLKIHFYQLNHYILNYFLKIIILFMVIILELLCHTLNKIFHYYHSYWINTNWYILFKFI